MFIYWRISQDLNALGENLIFNDPRFIRCYRNWVAKHFTELTLAHDIGLKRILQPHPN